MTALLVSALLGVIFILYIQFLKLEELKHRIQDLEETVNGQAKP